MKRLILMTLLVTGFCGHAEKEMSWQDVSNQDDWRLVDLESRQFQAVRIKAFKINREDYRIDELPASVKSNLKLASNNNFNEAGFRRWKRKCQDVANYTPYHLSKGNHFEVSIRHEPVEFDSVSWSTGGLGRAIIQNPPVLQQYQVAVQVVSGSVTEKIGGGTDQLASKLMNQQMKELEQGEDAQVLNFNLTGMDAVACDLANGKAKILIRGIYSYESPMATPEILLSSSKISQIHEELKELEKSVTGTQEALATSIILLSQELRRQESYRSDGQLLQWAGKLAPDLIDYQSGRVQQALSSVDYKQMSLRISEWKYSTYEGYIDYIYEGGE